MPEIELKTITGNKIKGYLNPLADELSEIASFWRFAIFPNGDIFVGNAAEITHADICQVNQWSISVGYFCIFADTLTFGIIQQNGATREEAINLIRRLATFENFAQGREMILKEGIF